MAVNRAARRPVRKPPSKIDLQRKGKNDGGNRYKPEPKRKKNLKIPLFPWRGVSSAFGWLLTIALGLLVFVGIGVGLLQGYKYFTSSEYFRLKTIELIGLHRLESREILEMAGLREDEYVNTLAVSIDKLEATLARNPWVAEISVKRVLPGSFIINIKEREPRFWVKNEGIVNYADGFGRVIAPVVNENFSSLPFLEIEPGAEIYAGRLPDLTRSLAESSTPLELEKISWLRVSAAGSLDLRLRHNNLLLSIGLEDWGGNLRRMGIALDDLGRRGELPATRAIKANGGTVQVEQAGS